MVVGVFLVVKPRGGLPFSTEDVVAAEMVAAAGAIGLYWCRGLGSTILTLSYPLTFRLTRQYGTPLTTESLNHAPTYIPPAPPPAPPSS